MNETDRQWSFSWGFWTEDTTPIILIHKSRLLIPWMSLKWYVKYFEEKKIVCYQSVTWGSFKKRGSFLQRMTLNKMTPNALRLVGRSWQIPARGDVMHAKARKRGSGHWDDQWGRQDPLEDGSLVHWGVMVHTGLYPESSGNPWRVWSRGMIR